MHYRFMWGEEIDELIWKNVRLYRQQRGLRQEQLDLHSGMNNSYIGQIERGEKNPKGRTLGKNCNNFRD